MELIDLSLTFATGMRGFESRPKTRLKDGYNTSDLLIYSHAGTHLDAPFHFLDQGETIENLDLHKCIGEALVVDLSFKSPNSLIQIDDLGQAADQIGRGTRVLLRTDWDIYANRPQYRTDFPRISLALANWFAAQGVWLVGVQSPSVASLQDLEELTLVHRALLEAGIIIVESLANLNLLPPRVFLVALPLKIAGGDGSPVRAVATF